MHNQIKKSEIETKTESDPIVKTNKRENLCIVQQVDKLLTNEEIAQQAKAQGFDLDIEVLDIANMVINGARETVKEIAKTQGLNYIQPTYHFLLVPSYLSYLKTEKECYGNEGLKGHIHSLTKTFLSVTGATTVGAGVAVLVGLVAAGPIFTPVAVFMGGAFGANLPSFKFEEYDYDYLVNYLTELKNKVLSENSKQLQETIENLPNQIIKGVGTEWQDLIKEQAKDPVQSKDNVYNNSSNDKQENKKEEAERIREEQRVKDLQRTMEQMQREQIERSYRDMEEQRRIDQMQKEQHERQREEDMKRSQENHDKMQRQQQEMCSQKIEPLYGSLLTNTRLMGHSDIEQPSCPISYTPAVTLPGSDSPTIMPYLEKDCSQWTF